MKVERNGNELLIRLNVGKKDTKIQDILNFFKYLELTSNTIVIDQKSDTFLKEIKKDRWKRNKDNKKK